MGTLRTSAAGLITALMVTVGGVTPADAAASVTGAVIAPSVSTDAAVVGPVVEATSGSIAATFTAHAGDGGTPAPVLAGWTATDEGARPLASGTCAASPCAVSVPLTSFTGGLPGSSGRLHSVDLQIKDADGQAWTTNVPVSVDVLPRLTVTAPASAARGGSVLLTASAKDGAGAELPGVPLQIQGRQQGSTSWNTLTTQAQPEGVGASASYTASLPASMEWRVYVAAQVGSHAEAASSTAQTTATTSSVTLSGLPSRATGGTIASLTATALPAGAGRQVRFETRVGTGSWALLSTTSTDASGISRLSYRLPASAARSVRATVAADALGDAASSAILTTTVTAARSGLALAGLPRKSTKGTTYTLTATATPAWTARTVSFQVLGGRSWRTFATSKAASSGRATARLTVTAAKVSVRALVAGDAYAAAATSTILATVATPASSKLTLSGLPARTTQGSSYRVTATVKPAAAGRLVTFQVRTGKSWKAVASARTLASGAAGANIKVTARYVYVRALIAGSALAKAAISNTQATIGRVPEPTRDYNCSDFNTWNAANSIFRKYYPDYGDTFDLDGDDDMIPCEALPGAP